MSNRRRCKDKGAGALDGEQDIPLFPLATVLFPGGRLPLQIFEPRYLDLVRRCMKAGGGFGVVLIRDGRETRRPDDAGPPALFDVGTYARIVDFNPLANGRLGITCQGDGKFRVQRVWETPDHLAMAAVRFLPDEPVAAVPEEFEGLVKTLRMLLDHPLVERLGVEADFGDARAVGWRLAELLPLEAETKQGLLQMQLPRERLLEVNRLVGKLRG